MTTLEDFRATFYIQQKQKIEGEKGGRFNAMEKYLKKHSAEKLQRVYLQKDLSFSFV